MRIAVTGSTGLVGRALVKAISQRGDEAIGVVRSTPGPSDIVWSIADQTIDPQDFEGLDAVVHLAGEGIADSKWTTEHKKRVLDSRVDGTDLLARTIATCDTPPKIFLSGSAVGFYGDRGEQALTEADLPGDGFLASVVAAWESAAAPAQDAGITTAFLRTGVVLSADGGALREQLPFFKAGLGGRIGSGNQYLSWISIADEVRAILHIIDSGLAGPINLTAPSPVTNSEFTATLGETLRRPTLLPTPRLALYARLGKEAAKEMVYSSTRVLPKKLLDSGFVFSHPTLESALSDALGV